MEREDETVLPARAVSYGIVRNLSRQAPTGERPGSSFGALNSVEEFLAITQ